MSYKQIVPLLPRPPPMQYSRPSPAIYFIHSVPLLTLISQPIPPCLPCFIFFPVFITTWNYLILFIYSTGFLSVSLHQNVNYPRAKKIVRTLSVLVTTVALERHKLSAWHSLSLRRETELTNNRRYSISPRFTYKTRSLWFSDIESYF